MNQDGKIEVEKIHIVNITTLKGNIEAAPDFEIGSIAGHRFSFETGHGFDREEKLAGLQLVVNINAVDEDENVLEATGSYTHEVVFKIENLDDFIEEAGENENSLQIDGLLGATLVGIAYSTIWGIIYVRTQGTSLGTVVLLVIDPKKLFS